MFNIGDLVIDGNDGKALFIAVEPTKISMIANNYDIIKDQGFSFAAWPGDRLATQEDITRIMNGRDFPQWVIDILTANGKLINPKASKPQEVATVHPKAQLGFDLPKPPPEIKQNSIMTLQTFQNQCIHDYRDYVGFSRIYRYCRHCDKKDE